MRWKSVVLALTLLELVPTAALAQDSPAALRSEAARLYLSQSLASVEQARAYAAQVAELGTLEGFDLSRYLTELNQVAGGLQRYLTPERPGPAATVPVAITGQYLLDGLQRGAPAARVTQPGE